MPSAISWLAFFFARPRGHITRKVQASVNFFFFTIAKTHVYASGEKKICELQLVPVMLQRYTTVNPSSGLRDSASPHRWGDLMKRLQRRFADGPIDPSKERMMYQESKEEETSLNLSNAKCRLSNPCAARAHAQRLSEGGAESPPGYSLHRGLTRCLRLRRPPCRE